jgi:hypothetical protein
LAGFTECAERGGNLNRYQSRKLTLADDKDLLLFDWGIHHFHLGREPHQRDARFAARTNDLLFARVTDDTIYILEVAPHGNWARKRLIETLHADWPETIAMYRVSALGTERGLTDSDHLELREAGCTTMVQMTDGTIYAPTGGGIATSRDSINAVLARDRSVARIKRIEKQAAVQADAWLTQIRQAGHTPTDPLRFRLVIRGSHLYAREEGSGQTFSLEATPGDAVT